MIEKLDSSVIKRIAAGEVIHCPQNAVKELLENSLDAGATSISIVLVRGGLDLLKIIDNGVGIKEEDMPLVCQRYTTSKLKDLKDLLQLDTFGFRGEALASISQISTVTVVSKHKESNLGYQAVYHNGVLKSKPKVHASNQGCIISVENLFNNIPIRKKALKSSTEEYYRVLDCVKKYSIHNFHVSFTLKKESNVDMACLKASNKLERIAQMYGKNTSLNLKSVQFEDSRCKLNMLFNKADTITSNGKDKFEFILFVNNRLVENAKLKREVKETYKAIASICKPYFVYIAIDVNPSHVDINIHPTKNEVHLLNEGEIVAKITSSLRESLGSPLNGKKKQKSLPIPLLEKETLNYYFKPINSQRRKSTSSSSSNVSSVTTPPPASPSSLQKVNFGETYEVNTHMEDNPFVMTRQTMGKEIMQRKDIVLNDDLQSKQSFISIGNKKRKSVYLNKTGNKQSASTIINQPIENLSSTEENLEELISIVTIKKEIRALEDKSISKLISSHREIGVIDDVLYAVTYKDRHYLMNYNVVSEEHFYQTIINTIGKFGVLKLSSPLPIQDLIAIYMPEATKNELNEYANVVLCHKELLKSYFNLGLTISDDQETIYLVCLPMIIPEYAPKMDRVPILLHNLAKNVDWDNEINCLDSLAHELASLYCCCDNRQWERILPHFRNGKFIAPKYLCDRGYVVELDFPETVMKK